MRNALRAGLVGLLVAQPWGVAMGQTGPEIGQPAPAFSATDSHGATRSLAEFKGKWVVLEWVNPECPYVRKHYNSGNMQRLQRTYTEKGVIWLSVASSAPGRQGHMTAEQANQFEAQRQAAATAILLDPTGAVGHLYDARNTPQMFVIDPNGVLLYDGAIDDHPTARPSDIEGARNYVAAALDEAMAGQPVTTPKTPPYGCTVKY
jgi:alkyl hydroperoxide reductase subunit AhpC